jgi:hypothetical protein
VTRNRHQRPGRKKPQTQRTDTTAAPAEFLPLIFEDLKALQRRPRCELTNPEKAREAIDAVDASLRELERIHRNIRTLRRAMLQKK